MDKKYIIIAILVLCLLGSLVYVNYLKGQISNEYSEGVKRYNQLFEEKDKLQGCFLDNLFSNRQCTLNCRNVECYENCDVKGLYNYLVGECVN